MSSEAEIVCNPIMSFQALHSANCTTVTGKGCQKRKRPTSSVLHTQAIIELESTRQGLNVKTPCMLCQKNGHKLHSCTQGKSLEERMKYIKEKKLCYGCLKPGHSAKNCLYRLVCEVCRKKLVCTISPMTIANWPQTSHKVRPIQNRPQPSCLSIQKALNKA